MLREEWHGRPARDPRARCACHINCASIRDRHASVADRSAEVNRGAAFYKHFVPIGIQGERSSLIYQSIRVRTIQGFAGFFSGRTAFGMSSSGASVCVAS